MIDQTNSHEGSFLLIRSRDLKYEAQVKNVNCDCPESELHFERSAVPR